MTAQINLHWHFFSLKLQCRKELEDRRNEWAKWEPPISAYEPCHEEDYDVEDFLPCNRSSNSVSEEEMVRTGWTPSSSDTGERNENQGVNSSSQKGKKKPNQAFNKSCNIKEDKKFNPTAENDSDIEEKKKSCQVSSKRRKKRPCPLEGCKSQVVDLPRHLRDVYKWPREKAQKATSKFGLRKSFASKGMEKEKENKWKDYHHHRKCPISGCHSTVKRLSNHLRQLHKEIRIRKGSSEYKAILKEASRKKKTLAINTGFK